MYRNAAPQILSLLSDREDGPLLPLVNTKPSMAAVAADSENLNGQSGSVQMGLVQIVWTFWSSQTQSRIRSFRMIINAMGEKGGYSPDDRVLRVLVPQLNMRGSTYGDVLLHHVCRWIVPFCKTNHVSVAYATHILHFLSSRRSGTQRS